jgi:hypothetical protein
MHRTKSISDISKEDIVRIVEKLGNAKLVIGAQLYDKYKNNKDVVTIKDAANKQLADYSTLAQSKPGLAILMVVLSAHSNYARIVEPRIKRLDLDNRIVTISDLKNELVDKEAFFTYVNYHHEKKYNTLLNLTSLIEKKLYPVYGENKTEYDLLHNWAKNVNLLELNKDPLRIRNFSLASIQHLRMIFGVNTTKPDQRVLEVFKNEFNLDLSQKKAIIASEVVASACNCEPLLIDQIFVNYGSGYYQKTTSKNNQ